MFLFHIQLQRRRIRFCTNELLLFRLDYDYVGGKLKSFAVETGIFLHTVSQEFRRIGYVLANKAA